MGQTADFLIVGGGIIGLNLALEARRRHPAAKILLIEKEPECGHHASGRNSGVLHAGFYYTADSLKARFTQEGNRRMAAYCEERGLRINRCGKLIVARDESDLPGLDELLRRATANKVPLDDISAADARQIEPRARTYERALFSPTTATVDPREVVASLARDARRAGIVILTSTAYLGRSGSLIRTTSDSISPGYLINAAGLYADRLAHDFGFADSYRILPFKGLYLIAEHTGTVPMLRTHIYPVPQLDQPFLGVHFTVTTTNRVKIGPTALPAFWREQYRWFDGFDLREFLEIVRNETALFMSDSFGFRTMAWREIQKTSRRHLLALASKLVVALPSGVRWRWGQPGIRAQLVNVGERKLEMDFRYEGDDRSFHVLNAVSPAFTCSIPFCEFAFDEIERCMGARHSAPAVAERVS